jgi:hypothetical protein
MVAAARDTADPCGSVSRTIYGSDRTGTGGCQAETRAKDTMNGTILKPGEKIFVIHRQIIAGEARRHFFGVVDDCVGDLARVTGRVFSFDSSTNLFAGRDVKRTRIIPLSSAEVIVNILPATVDIDKIAYSAVAGGKLHITDGTQWHLDISRN